jgi:hypothetical protein
VVLVGGSATTRAGPQARPRRRSADDPQPAPALGLDRTTFGLADIVSWNETTVLVAAEAKRTGRRAASADDPARLARRLLGEPRGRGVGERSSSRSARRGANAGGRAVEEPLGDRHTASRRSIRPARATPTALAAALAEDGTGRPFAARSSQRALRRGPVRASGCRRRPSAGCDRDVGRPDLSGPGLGL